MPIRLAITPTSPAEPATLAYRSGPHEHHRDGHLLVCGDNAGVLPALAEEGRVFEVIYLDPPYDTGRGLSYADDYGKDWADFYHHRLVAATRMLHPDRGVVIVAIDDRRMPWARLITDHVLGAEAFLACVVWDGGVKGQARFVSTSHDYMLIYAANPTWWRRHGQPWREPKPGAREALEQAARLWDGDPDSSRQAMDAWYKSLSASNPAKSLYLYRCFDNHGRLYREGPVSKPSGGGYVYDVHHPVTGLPVVPPATGWRYRPQRMKQMLDEGRIVFRADHTSSVATKLFLDEQTDQVATSVFTEKRTRAAKRLAAQVGAGKFTYPKDTLVLARWLNLVTAGRRDARFLDPFAGSGAMAQAVMEMNTADGGTRTSASVTLNEVDAKTARRLTAQGLTPGDPEWESRGLFEQVTLPRLQQAAREHDQHLQVADAVSESRGLAEPEPSSLAA